MKSNDVRLYQSNASPNSRRVRIFLAEKNMSVETVNVDLGTKEQFSDAYRVVNAQRCPDTRVGEWYFDR
jgi:glutathione S-transferase